LNASSTITSQITLNESGLPVVAPAPTTLTNLTNSQIQDQIDNLMVQLKSILEQLISQLKIELHLQ